MKKILKIQKKKGFTLAEILITMSIIGIVAAISIPSLLVNINDKTYDAQRNAMLARMSQAVGQMDDINSYASTAEASAVNFISKGLSKVYKVSSVCGAGHLDSCDIPGTIKLPDGNSYELKDVTSFSNYSSIMTAGASGVLGGLDAAPAGFMTGNGESMFVLYNPKCTDKHDNAANVLNEVCVNIIYDLNGAGKAPNQVGKDVGFLTILYPSTPTVVAPVPYTADITGTSPTFTSKPSYSTTAGGDAASACSALNGDLILPDRESLISMVVNKGLIANLGDNTFWSSTVTKPGSSGFAWAIKADGEGTLPTRGTSNSILCIKK